MTSEDGIDIRALILESCRLQESLLATKLERITELERQLAAPQLREKVYRDALNQAVCSCWVMVDRRRKTETFLRCSRCQALAQPSDPALMPKKAGGLT